MNKVILIGRMTKDPELQQMKSGTSMVRFSVAVQRKFKNANGEYETDFINCVAWKQTAEFISRFFGKGRMIAVVGSLQSRSFDANDGSKRFVTEVVVDEAEFVTPKENNAPQQTTPVSKQGGFEDYAINEEEIPF